MSAQSFQNELLELFAPAVAAMGFKIFNALQPSCKSDNRLRECIKFYARKETLSLEIVKQNMNN